MRTLTMSLLALLLALPAPGQDATADPAIGASLQEADLGTYWYGTLVDKRDLIGKVVLMEIWGS